MKKVFASGYLLVPLLIGGCSKHEDATSSPANPPQSAAAVSNPATGNAPAPGTMEKEYVFKGVGVLRLTFPKAWADSPNRIMEGNEPVNVIEFVPFSGNDFQIHVEVRNLGERVTKAFDIRASLLKAGGVELPNCVEQSLDIHDFKGPEVTGAYYTVTDKRYLDTQPKPGEYKYLTQGYAKLAGMVLKFRLVSNQPPGEEQTDAVKMIQSARFMRR